jgi:hypothetical protein
VMDRIDIGEKRHIGGWLGTQYGVCVAEEEKDGRVYFMEESSVKKDSMPVEKWLERMPVPDKPTYTAMSEDRQQAILQRLAKREAERQNLGEDGYEVFEVDGSKVFVVASHDARLFNPFIDALVEVALLTGEDWSSYAPNKTGTEEDVKKSVQFRRDLIEKPEMLVDAMKQLRDDLEEGSVPE